MSVKMHPRTQVVRKAKLEIALAVDAIVEKHGLTYVETVQGIAEVLSSRSKWALREERHPDDPDQPADRE